MRYLLFANLTFILTGISYGLECLHCDELLNGAGTCDTAAKASANADNYIRSCDSICYKAIGAPPLGLQKRGCVNLSFPDQKKYVGKCTKTGEFLERQMQEINTEIGRRGAGASKFDKLAEYCVCADRDRCNAGARVYLNWVPLVICGVTATALLSMFK